MSRTTTEPKREINVSVPLWLFERIDEISRNENFGKSQIARSILNAHIHDFEKDYEAIQEKYDLKIKQLNAMISK